MRLKSNARAFASRTKAKAIPQRRISASSATKPIPIGERTWTDIEPQESPLSDNSVSKKLINLIRHGNLPREDDGAIEFWRIKDHLQNHFVCSQHWSDDRWKSSTARGGGNKKMFQYCTDSSGQEILYLRALQGHSGRNLIDLTLQDNVLIPNNFFQYMLVIFDVQFTLHHKFWINTWRSKIRAIDRQYSFGLWIPWTKTIRILIRST